MYYMIPFQKRKKLLYHVNETQPKGTVTMTHKAGEAYT